MFNQTIAHLWMHPYHRGTLTEADATGQEGTIGEGPYMTITLRIEGEDIIAGYFETYGCPATIACGSWLMRWIEGKTCTVAASIQSDELCLVLGGLPAGKEHGAEIAIKALNAALDQIPENDGY